MAHESERDGKVTEFVSISSLHKQNILCCQIEMHMDSAKETKRNTGN